VLLLIPPYNRNNVQFNEKTTITTAAALTLPADVISFTKVCRAVALGCIILYE